MHDIASILEVMGGILDEAERSDADAPIYTERDLVLSSAWGAIAMVRSLGDPALVEAIFQAHPELVHE